MNIGGGEIVVLVTVVVYLIVGIVALYLAFTLVSAIVRISHALESASQSLGEIAKKYNSPPAK